MKNENGGVQQGFAIDKERLMTFRDFLKQLISEVKVRFLKSKITDWQGKKYIFNMVCTFLLKKSWVKLSNHNPRDVLLSMRFSKFFTVSCKKKYEYSDESKNDRTPMFFWSTQASLISKFVFLFHCGRCGLVIEVLCEILTQGSYSGFLAHHWNFPRLEP